MSQKTDAERRAEEKHPEIFNDPDAGQASSDDRRPPESFEVSALRKGCLWAVVLTGLLLLIVAVTWRWAWEEAEPRLPGPADRDRPGLEVGSPEVGQRAHLRSGGSLAPPFPALGDASRWLEAAATGTG